MQEEKVVLVDQKNNQIGLMPKMEAHLKGVLHRAFSVIIFNSSGEIMLQKRASTKYHTPKLWSNTCCSHQREKENNISAGKRRLKEEMGFVTNLYDFDSFIYHVSFSNGLQKSNSCGARKNRIMFFDGVRRNGLGKTCNRW